MVNPWRSRSAGGAREGGAMLVATIPVVAGLLFVATVLIVMLGSASSDRRGASSAADAAALAAVQEWDRRLEAEFADHVSASTADEFWALAGSASVTWSMHAGMYAAAQDYAGRNDMVLVDMSVNTVRHTVTVQVRAKDEVPGTSTRMEGTATAELDLNGGLCFSGPELGYLIGGSCRTEPEPAPPSPSPTDDVLDPDPSTPPFDAPPVGGYDSDTSLVR